MREATPGDIYQVFSLTDNWSSRGTPVEWGIEPIINRLKAIDMWSGIVDPDAFFKEQDKVKEQKDKDFRNTMESFLYEFRSQFAKATNDINTSSLERLDSRRKRSA